MDISTSENVNAKPIRLDLPAIKGELTVKRAECQQRGLAHSYKWLAEIAYALRKVKAKAANSSMDEDDESAVDEEDVYAMAKSYFDLKEYDRSAFFAKGCTKAKGRFLHLYSRYLSGEKKLLDDMTDFANTGNGSENTEHLTELRAKLEKLHKDGVIKEDGYTLYLYGIVLKKLGLKDQAKKLLLEAINIEPCHWGAWLELTAFVGDRAELLGLDLPDHWIKHFFIAHTNLELQLNNEALEIYGGLQRNDGLNESTYILAQIAIAYHNLREVDKAVGFFEQLSEHDPYRLDNLDVYSNLLYVKEYRVELAHLAHKVVKIDKYRTETCCVIGNYYSLRSEHEKAVVYFQRALKLNPNYLSAWTLMGHEYIELKNTNAAVQSYRHAVQVNKRDYRAWYGLGQTYELLKMPYYSLYYYKKAQELRPNDSRMLVALGESFEKLNKVKDAMKCFWKAHCVGDIEGGIALFQLAKLYEKQPGSEDQAAAAYQQYLFDVEGQEDRDNQSKAYRFLAQYFLKKPDCLDEAYACGTKCTEYPETLEEGKAILREIANRKGQQLSQQKAADQELFKLHSTAKPEEDDDEEEGKRKPLEPTTLNFTP